MKKKIIALALSAACAGGGVMALTAPAEAATPATCSGTEASIFTPPTTVPTTSGELISCRPIVLTGILGAPAITSWQVQYATKNVSGVPTAASATIIVPKAAWKKAGTRPLVAYTPGTLGVAPKCGLSRGLASVGETALVGGSGIGDLLQAGFAVAAADGIGFLDGQVHPYVVGGSAGRAVLDAARTAFQVPGTGLVEGTKVGIDGYSEGGHSALWAAQLARGYSPDLNVVGAAAGGVPGDLKITAANLNGSAFAGFLADAAIGQSSTYTALPFDSILNARGKATVAKLKTTCVTETILDNAFTTLGDFTTGNLSLDQIYALKGTDGSTWGQRIDEQKVGVGVGAKAGSRYRIDFPVFQYRGFVDEVIPPKAQEYARTSYCKAGVATKWQQYPGDHVTTALQASLDVKSFLDARFAGKTEKGNC